MSELQRKKMIKILDWNSMDIERKLRFKGSKYTDVNMYLSFMFGALLTLMFYGAVVLAKDFIYISEFFLKRGITQYATMFFSYWSLAILFFKWRKLIVQQKALTLAVVPHAHNFELTVSNAKDILERMHDLVDNTEHFILLNRIDRALSNLHNIGMIADVSEVLRSQAENDEDTMESSYALVKGFIWAIPVLGFIGTVLGLSQAIGNFGTVLSAAQGIENLKDSLRNVTSGLSVAFDTTLLALIAALSIQLILIALKKKEENFLDECKEYCHANIISKLRLVNDQQIHI
ncbi:MAG: MotA/TolQ/ExbB proton channel family protein [Desulfobacterales bacterium]|nr:MotA/TolQ/ExbB proton channel family protein [Desulfobacterales bacterium]